MTTTKKTEDIIIKDEVVKEIIAINEGRVGDAQKRPNLAIVMIGGDEAATSFVDNLEKEAIRVGVDTHDYRCPADSEMEEIEAMIECLNEDELIDAIYLHLPVPPNFNEEDIVALVLPSKDISYLVENASEGAELREAKLFRGTLENYKKKEDEV